MFADTTTFADLHGHGARNIVARCEVFVVGRITLHKTLTLGVRQVTAFAACAFGDQTAGAVDAGRVELHELHILKRQTCACHHAATVAGAGMGRGRGEIGPAITAGRQHHHLGVEDMHGAIIELPAHHTLTLPVVGHDQVDGEILDVEFRVVLEALTIERVQDRVAGAVGGGTGALHRRAFAKLGGVAAEGTLVDLAFLGARKGHAIVFKLIDRLGRFTGEVFHRVGVTQPVGALDGVIHVPLPAVGPHVAKRGGDATLRRHGVRAGRENLGYTGRAQALLSHAKRRTQTRATGAHNHHVIFVGFIFICCCHRLCSLPRGSQGELDEGKETRGNHRVGEGRNGDQRQFFRQPVHVVLHRDLRLAHQMDDANHQREASDDRRYRASIIGQHLFIGTTQTKPKGDHEGRNQKHQQDGADHHLPVMMRPCAPGPKAFCAFTVGEIIHELCPLRPRSPQGRSVRLHQ